MGGTKSEVGDEFLLLVYMAKARTKGVFLFTDIGFSYPHRSLKFNEAHKCP